VFVAAAGPAAGASAAVAVSTFAPAVLLLVSFGGGIRCSRGLVKEVRPMGHGNLVKSGT
jgi:hypothetical protein